MWYVYISESIWYLGCGSSNPSPLGGNSSPVSNGSATNDQSSTRIPLNPAEIMAAASAAVSKQKQGNSNLTGGKIRLSSTAASNSSASSSASKFQNSGGNKAGGANTASASSSKHTNGSNNTTSNSGKGSDNSSISTNGNGDSSKVNSKLSSKNGSGSGGSGGGNGGKDSDKHRGDKNRGGGSSTSTNKAQEPPQKKQKVRIKTIFIIGDHIKHSVICNVKIILNLYKCFFTIRHLPRFVECAKKWLHLQYLLHIKW